VTSSFCHAYACIHPSIHHLIPWSGFIRFLFPSFLPFPPSDARTRPCQVMCHVSLSLSRTIDDTWASAPSRAIAAIDFNSRARSRGSFSRCLSRHLPFGVHRRRYRGCGHWCKSPRLCGLRDRLHLAGYLSISPGLHLSKERSPGAHRRQVDDRPQGGKREAGGRPWSSLFVLHRQRLPRVVQLKPLPFRRTRAGMWPAIPCDESSGLAWRWSRSKAVIPFL
jgi:hypothetical protein